MKKVKGWPDEARGEYSDDYEFFAGNVLGWAHRATPMEAIDACREHTDREVQLLIAIPKGVEYKIQMYMPQAEGMIIVFSTIHIPEQRGSRFCMRPKIEENIVKEQAIHKFAK